MRSLHVFIGVIVLITFSTILGRASDFEFSNLTTRDGLHHKTITYFQQDQKGYLWIGTTNGLSRFDGYHFKVFMHDDDDRLSLKGNLIREVIEGSSQKLWVSSIGGVFEFDLRKEAFHRITAFGQSTYQSQTVCVDAAGVLWGLTEKNKYLVSIDTSTLTITTKLNIDSLAQHVNLGYKSNVRYLNNQLWICAENGLLCYDPRKKQARTITNNNKPMFNFIRFLKQGRTKSEILAIDGHIGIYKINAQNNTYSLIPIQVFKQLSPDILFITDAEYDNSGGLWVTATPGVFYISPNGKVQKVNKKSGSNYNFDFVITNCVYKDNAGNIWIGSMSDGVFVHNSRSYVFSHVAVDSATQGDVSISSLLVTDDKIYGGNLQNTLIFNRDTMPNRIKQLQKISSPTVSISRTKNNTFLLFNKEDIVEYDAKTGSKRSYWKHGGFQKGFIDSRGIVWTMHWGFGMYGRDVARDKNYKIDIDTIDRSRNIFCSLTEDTDGSFWCGTFGTGLVHIQNPAAAHPKITIYANKEGKNSISENIVLCLHDDGHGAIWIGTNGGGLNRFDKKTEQFEVFNIKNGLKNNVVEAINSDLDGNIWFTSSIVSKYDIRKKSFSHYDELDGIKSKYFTNASFRDKDGVLYFGDDSGILLFNPRKVVSKEVPTMPTLTGVKLFGQLINPRQQYNNETPFPTAVDYAQRIELPYYLNSISIEFASLQVLNNKTINYNYRLAGSDKKWSAASINERSANYSELQPGTYRFMVRASNESNVWSQTRSIEIVILPPWWKTLIFKLSVAIVLAGMIGFILYSRFREIKKRNQMLESLVTERTKELKVANQTLSEQSEELVLQAQSLQEQNNSLQEQKMMIEVKNQQLSEALSSKDKLIGIIAHDFKNPLSVISGMSTVLRDNLQQYDLSKIETLVSSIASASDNLKNQMLTVLDWAQSKVQELSYRPLEVNIETLINDCLELVRESAQQKQINIGTQFDFAACALVDPRMISTVLRNLLMNAIKFTPRNGLISIFVLEYAEGIEVMIEDTGIGIAPEKLPHLFDGKHGNSSFGTNNERGVGLGLQICKSFIEQNGGTIVARSLEGKGSTFSVTMPKGSALALRRGRQQLVAIKNERNNQSFTIAIDKAQTILLIDDNANVLTLFKEIFEPYFTLITATDGDAGLELAQTNVPSLIISDINMPRRNGLTLCQQLKSDEMCCHIPIILLTSDAGLQNESFASGADAFIEKPFNKHTILLKVHALLENRKKLIAQLQSKTDNKGFILPDSFNDTMMQKIFNYINANFISPSIDIIEVSEHVGLSRSQLWRKFKASTGQNVSDYVQELRLQKAREMLLTGKYKVAEVAYDVGFSNPQYFSRSFSARFGDSPKDCIDRAKSEAASV